MTDPPNRAALRPTRPRFWFWIVIGAAAIVRFGYVAEVKSGTCDILSNGKAIGRYHSQCTGSSPTKPNDQLYYNSSANQLAWGKGFVSPFGKPEPVADHPPLNSIFLATASWLFNHEPLSRLADSTVLTNHKTVHTHVREQRYFVAALGVVNVGLIMLISRRVGGKKAGVIAGFIAAVYPGLWVNDGLLFAETLAITMVCCALLMALRCHETRTAKHFAALGAICGLAALTRAELLLLAPLLMIVPAVRGRGPRLKRALVNLGAGGFALVLVLLPWFAYNATRFNESVLISTNDGLALAGSYCPPVFEGPGIGLWSTDASCKIDPSQELTLRDQSEVSKAYRKHALDFLRMHKQDLPRVVAARIGRTWNLFRPVQGIRYNEGENRERWVGWAALVSYYLLILPAIFGAAALLRFRERRSLWVLLAPAITVTLVSAATYGQPRFRATAEPSLVIFAALGIVAMLASIHESPGARNQPMDPVSSVQ